MSDENGNEAVTFTQDQVNEMIAQANTAKDEEYKGILAKNDELLGEKKAAKARATEAEQQRQLLAEQQARTNGNMEELEKTLNAKHQKELDTVNAQLNELNNTILGGKKSEVIARLASEFVSPAAAELMLANMVDSSYGEDKQVVTQFKGVDGTVVTTDSQEFLKQLRSNEAFTPLLKAVDSSGGGSTGSKATGSASSDTTELRLKARLKKSGII